ncbi:hypothetical protein AB0C34_08550 [Nocardia sp. NPDC049220]|uniref:hypothetical protein n=1 Tax=Nocardia sp. NPDC049220 TaxID=3155273 RepID=UPI0033F4B72B
MTGVETAALLAADGTHLECMFIDLEVAVPGGSVGVLADDDGVTVAFRAERGTEAPPPPPMNWADFSAQRPWPNYGTAL